MARKPRADDKRFDLTHADQFKRLRRKDGWGSLGRRLARDACIICQMPQVTETLSDAHIHPKDVHLSDPPTLDRVFRLCANHHAMYDCHIIETFEVLAAEGLTANRASTWLSNGQTPSPNFDVLIIPDLHSGKRKAIHAKAARAVAEKERKARAAGGQALPNDDQFFPAAA